MEDLMEIIPQLDDRDKKELSNFALILFHRGKYNRLRKELEARRTEIDKGETLSHEALWANH